MALSKMQYTLAATALGSSLAFIDGTAVIVALPTMQKALNLGLSGEQWIFLSYALALASLYLVGGSLGDRYGHRKVFNWGVIGFAIASLLAGLAPNAALMIVARVLQGVSGAFVTTNSLAWLRNVYGDNAGKAVGLWTALTGISTVIAPPLGGALTQWFSWRYIFYINLPLAAVILYWSARAVPDETEGATPNPLDIPGSLLIASSFGFLTYYLVEGAKTGFRRLWWTLLIGIVSLVAFIVVELKSRYPMLPFKLFKIRNFSFSNLETLLLYGALNGVFVYLTLYLQFLGLSPLASSLFLVPTSLILIALARYFGGLADLRGPRVLLSVGPALIAAGSFLFSIINTKEDIWLRGSLGMVLFSIGLAMIVAPITTTALKSVPSKFAGIASGVNNTVARLGGLIVIAVAGMMISIIFAASNPDQSAVPLDLHQTSVTQRQASHKGYQIAMWSVSGLALASAAVGWFGIRNPKTAKTI